MRVSNWGVLVRGAVEQSNEYFYIPDRAHYVLVLRSFDQNRRADAVVKIDGKHIGVFRLEVNETLEITGPPDDAGHGKFTFYAAGSEQAAAVGEADVTRSDKGLISVRFVPEYRRRDPDAWSRPTAAGRPGVDRRPPVDLIGNIEPGTNRRWKTTDDDTGWPGAAGIFSEPKAGFSEPRVTTTCQVTRGDQTAERRVQVEEKTSGGIVLPAAPGVTGVSGRTDQRWTDADPIHYDELAAIDIHIRLVVPTGPVLDPDRPRPLRAVNQKSHRPAAIPAPVG